MEWLTPMTALYAGAAAVPLLLVLYFLKLKRREQMVSSTLLWKRAVQDLQVNAPFQRIRRNILLLLQLLMLLAVLFALAGPILSMMGTAGRRYVLLIDRSASMNATDIKPTRLDAIKKEASQFVQSLRNKAFFSIKGGADQVMVIAFDNRSKVMCNFSSDKRQLLGAIASITPSDGDSLLAEAITVARAFAQSPGEEAGNRSAEEPAKLVLFSDGRISDLDQIVVGADELVFNRVGETQENLAITAMRARRSYENPHQVSIFATVANFGTEPVSCDVQLSLNGDVQALRSITVPAKRADPGTDANQPGKTAIDFSLSHAEAGVLEVRQLRPDCLPCDDAAWAVLSPPRKLSVLLVTAGNIVLESALKASPLASLEIRSPAQFDAMDHSALTVDEPYDLIVLDSHVPKDFPRCRYLVFGRPPEGIDVSVSKELENQIIVDWRPRHPVLKYVNLGNLFAAKCHELNLPRDAEVLAEFNETPALALVRRTGSVFLLAGFDLLQTNWPFEPSFVLFCYNAASFLGMELGEEQQAELEVGEPIVVEGLGAGAAATMNGPGFADRSIEANPAGSIRFPDVDRVGVYSLEAPDQPARFFAVNLLDAEESNIEPADKLILSDQPVEAQQSPVSRANLPLWSFLVGLALILASLEWLVYNSKVRI